MKYLLRKDLSWLKKKPFRVFLVIIILEIIFQNVLVEKNAFNILLGRNLEDFKNYLASLFYFLNLLFYIYMTLYIFISDLMYNLDNIFLRITPIKFMIEKILYIIMSIVIFRIIQYMAIIPLIIKTNLDILLLINMSIKDILYYSLISIICVFFRELYYKIGNFYIFLAIIVVGIAPRNFDISYLYYILGIAFFSANSIIFMKIKSKKIIEKEGENK